MKYAPLLLLLFACQSAPRAPELAKILSPTSKPQTLSALAADLLQPRLAPATLEGAGAPRIASVTQDPGDPRYHFEIWGVRESIPLADLDAVAVLHVDGSVTIFGMKGWHSVEDIDGGYKIKYFGEAVNCTVYVSTVAPMVRLNTGYSVGDATYHDVLLGAIMRYLPRAPELAIP